MGQNISCDTIQKIHKQTNKNSLENIERSPTHTFLNECDI